jgi:hypothetical protein
LRYHRLSHYLARQFGSRVWKLSLDAGFDCPNRDGTLGRGGCIFCDPAAFSPSRRQPAGSITGQIDAAIERLRGRRDAKCLSKIDSAVLWCSRPGCLGRRDARTTIYSWTGTKGFLAYFQPATNTYAPVDRLRAVYEEALAHPAVVGLAIGTRPDCVGDDVLDLLAELSRRAWLTVEYGLQTIHDRSLDWLRRGHHYDAFLDAVARSRRRGLRVGAHVILGLPGETADDMTATARELARLRIDAVKIHNLYVVRDTPLADALARGELALATLDEHVERVVNFLEHLPPDCVIERLSGDAPAAYLVAPAWCARKAAVRAAVETELLRRDTWQGRLFADKENIE